MAWVLDAETENTPLSTTGGHTWAAARRLAAYLSAAADELGLQRPGLRLLELGAGTGWLGVTAARNLPDAALICLTEQEGGLAWLRHNVALNAGRGLPLAHMRVQPCDWLAFAAPGDLPPSLLESLAGGAAAGGAAAAGEQQQQQQQLEPGTRAAETAAAAAAAEAVDLRITQWDCIIGSDLIYNEILYCHTKHRFDLLDAEFLEQLAACGLRCEEVWEPGVVRPPPSPPPAFPPVDLFPEQRIAVWRISRQ